MKIKEQLHSLEANDKGLRCVLCKRWFYLGELSSLCLGVPTYQWDNWPDPFVTKSQLSKAGYKPGPLRAVIPYSKSSTGDGYLHLFNPDEGIRRKPPTEKQLAARAKRKAAEEAKRTCSRCKHLYPSTLHMHKCSDLCEDCYWQEKFEVDRQAAAEWARERLAEGFVVLDTETTGLRGRVEIVELAIIDHTGAVLVNSRVKAQRPERSIESGAIEIHGIRPEDLVDAPTFGELYPAILQALHGKYLVVYNLDFDLDLVEVECLRWYCPMLELADSDCAMSWYAKFCGDWSHYWGSYKWQPLPGGDHSALGDARATLGVIKAMAAQVVAC